MRDYFYFHYFYCKFSKYGYFWGAAPSLYLPAMKDLSQLQVPTSRLIEMQKIFTIAIFLIILIFFLV